LLVLLRADCWVLLRAEIAVGDARKIAGQLGELVDLIGEVAGVRGSAARL